jgi:hypothetical protein
MQIVMQASRTGTNESPVKSRRADISKKGGAA